MVPEQLVTGGSQPGQMQVQTPDRPGADLHSREVRKACEGQRGEIIDTGGRTVEVSDREGHVRNGRS